MKPITVTYWAMPVIGTIWYLTRHFAGTENTTLFSWIVGAVSLLLCVSIVLNHRKEKPRDEREDSIHFAATQAGFLAAVLAWLPLSFFFRDAHAALYLMMIIMWGVQTSTFSIMKKRPARTS